MSLQLKNKVAVVTGASSGIGLAIAQTFAAEGAKVVLAARRKNKLQKIVNGIKGEAAFCVCDVAKLQDIDKLVSFTQQTYGQVDILVANAGITDFTHVRDVTETLFDKMVNTNYKGLYFTVQRFLPLITPGASIILISSIACRMGFYAHSLYSSTKSAVSQLAKNFASDLVDEHIRVNAILPGPIDTAIFDVKNTATPGLKEKVTQMVPLGKIGSSEEVAELALYLARDVSAFVTGQDFIIDGGFSTLRR